MHRRTLFLWGGDRFLYSNLSLRSKQANGKVHLATAFLKECISESKDVLDDDAITDIIKTCNIIKNDLLQLAKKKVKGQAQKSKKKDKTAEKKAQKMAVELYGENDKFDDYDAYGAEYEDAFFQRDFLVISGM